VPVCQWVCQWVPAWSQKTDRLEGQQDSLRHWEGPGVLCWYVRRLQSVTILTPFSTSPMTDASVDALPNLFLAYCAMDHADSNFTD
jgi:hypothetical protein